ncbi:hypothetical protein HIM_06350 [Hirsutella minnesotensis 3608]|uniref:Hydrophobin 3 n=1 Tax=Hirsutella minnesotensis 3608 TaxID=1043627 RepID=A0A0F8A4X6_9HYPO|nr:hypothetical protein HIM_06350 [Hirsutella minnesotensis 3608]
MQFAAVIFALAAAAMAAPAELQARRISHEECSASHNKQACCNGAANCLIQVVGDNCKNEAYCCKTGHSVGLLVNVNALNCLKLE